MDEIKKNEISADTLKMRVKAGLDRQKDAAKSIREEDKPNIIENAAEDYPLEKQDNPYVNLSVDDIIGQLPVKGCAVLLLGLEIFHLYSVHFFRYDIA